MISALRAVASATIAGPAECARSRRVEDANAVGVADRNRLVELGVSDRLEVRGPVGQGAVEWHLEHVQRDDPARRSAASWHATSIAASDG